MSSELSYVRPAMAAHSNTARTILGFIRAFLGRRLPFLDDGEGIDDIYNYLQIENLFATSGQPSEAQFRLIGDAGYETVINLAPTSVLENSVIDEDQILADLGMTYVHIPVDFKEPTEDDFSAFVDSLRDSTPQNVWVHCAANMRVSAFTYRYRREVLAEDDATARSDLHRIWEPVGVWKEFINR